jgi:formate/nitrite transporter FocA (FNT family)
VSDSVTSAFDRALEEGERRLERTWPRLFATGMVGGIDVGVGVFALLLVLHETGSILLGGLAFGIGFVALTLANSELFTEDFLVPVAALAAKRSTVAALVRLWSGTLVTNLVGGWLIMAIVIGGFAELRPTAVEVASHYVERGIGWPSFATAMLGGGVITLMTWEEHATGSMVARLIAAVSAAFLLGAGELNHAVVVSLEMFAALQAGAPFGYADWLGAFVWASFGNLVGGVGLVTGLRLVQVGAHKVEHERERSEATGADRDWRSEGQRSRADV